MAMYMIAFNTSNKTKVLPLHHLQVKSSTALAKPLPLQNFDQSGNLLKQSQRQFFCFIHIEDQLRCIKNHVLESPLLVFFCYFDKISEKLNFKNQILRSFDLIYIRVKLMLLITRHLKMCV